MRKLFPILLLLLSSKLMASEFDSRIINIYASNQYENFDLTTQSASNVKDKAATEKTCFKKKHIGTKQVCGPSIEETCQTEFTPGDYVRRLCDRKVIETCKSEPIFKDVEYTCNLDLSKSNTMNKEIKNRINLTVRNNTDKTLRNKCIVYFEQLEDHLSYKAMCDDFLVKIVEDKTKRIDARLVEKTITLELNEGRNLLAPVAKGISNITLQGPILSFKAGNLAANKRIALNLSLDQKPLLKKSQSIFNRDLLPSEYMFEKTNEAEGIVRINLAYLMNSQVDLEKALHAKVSIRLLDDLSKVINIGNFKPLVSSEAQLNK